MEQDGAQQQGSQGDRFDAGHVAPGGPPRSWRMRSAGSHVEVVKRSVGPMDNNVYVLRAPSADGSDVILIDAADDARAVLGLLDPHDHVAAIVTTHRHADHWQALPEVANATGAPVLAGAEDADSIGHPVDRRLADGDVVEAGGIRLDVLATPGHTPGSVCLLLRTDDETRLFSGDTLFPGGPGNTFGDPEAFATIMRSLREQLFRLSDDVRVHPGHGDDTTLGRERGHLDEWEARGW